MIGRAIRAAARTATAPVFVAGDWLLGRFTGELMPAIPTQAELDTLIAELFDFDGSVSNLTDNDTPSL